MLCGFVASALSTFSVFFKFSISGFIVFGRRNRVHILLMRDEAGYHMIGEGSVGEVWWRIPRLWVDAGDWRRHLICFFFPRDWSHIWWRRWTGWRWFFVDWLSQSHPSSKSSRVVLFIWYVFFSCWFYLFLQSSMKVFSILILGKICLSAFFFSSLFVSNICCWGLFDTWFLFFEILRGHTC